MSINSFSLTTTTAGLNSVSGVYTINTSQTAYNDLPKTTDGFYYTVNGNYQHLFVDVLDTMTQSPINITLGNSATKYSTNNDNSVLVAGSHPVHQILQVGVRDSTKTTFLPFATVKNIILSNTGDDPNSPGTSAARVNALTCAQFIANVSPTVNINYCTDINAITTSTINSSATTTTLSTTTKPDETKLNPIYILLIVLVVIISSVLIYFKYIRHNIRFSRSKIGV